MGYWILGLIVVAVVGLVLWQERQTRRRYRGPHDARGHTPDAPPGDGFQPPHERFIDGA